MQQECNDQLNATSGWRDPNGNKHPIAPARLNSVRRIAQALELLARSDVVHTALGALDREDDVGQELWQPQPHLGHL